MPNPPGTRAAAGGARGRPAPTAARARAVEAFAAAVLANGAAATALHARVAARVGLSVSDLTVLDLLAAQGPLTAGELGAATGLASASVTGLIDRLEAGAFVRRARDPADGRRVRVGVRTEAMRRVGQAFAALGLDLEALAAPYDAADLARTTTILEEVTARVRDALAADDRARTG